MNDNEALDYQLVKQPITRDTWPQFFRNDIDEDQTYMVGFMHARRTVTKFMDNLIKSSTSDAEIVSKMMEFMKESHQLINHFDEILYGPDAEKYGLINPDAPLSTGQPQNTPNQ